MQGMTKNGLPLIALENGVVQIGSFVFQPDDADKIAAFIEDSKKLRQANDAPNTRTRKKAEKAD